MMGEVTGALDTVISPRKLEFTAALTATQKASTTCAATPRAAALRIVCSPFFDPVIGLFIIAATVCAVICPAVGCPPDILPITSAFNWVRVKPEPLLLACEARGCLISPDSRQHPPHQQLMASQPPQISYHTAQHHLRRTSHEICATDFPLSV